MHIIDETILQFFLETSGHLNLLKRSHNLIIGFSSFKFSILIQPQGSGEGGGQALLVELGQPGEGDGGAGGWGGRRGGWGGHGHMYSYL